MTESPPQARIPDSHKNAFWIYGVTAMIMREPLAVVVRNLSAAGIGNRAVQVECLRTLAILLILSKQFLGAGVFFDRVYLQPDAAAKFPRRSYPVDFLARLADMLIAVAASTTVGLESYGLGGLAPFSILVGIVLLIDGVWLAVARCARYSTVPEIAPAARASFLAFLVCAVVYAGVRMAGIGLAGGDILILCVVILFTGFQLAGQVRSYGRP